MKNIIRESVLNYPRKKLDPSIWRPNGKLKPEIRNMIMSDLSKLPKPIINSINLVYATGSLAGYQYTIDSDFDIHIYIDKDTLDDFGFDLKHSDVKSYLPDRKIPGTEHILEYNFIDYDEREYGNLKGGMYDVINDEWIEEPTKPDKKIIPYYYIIEIAKYFISGVDNKIMEINALETEINLLLNVMESDLIDEDDKNNIQKSIYHLKEKIVANADALYLHKQMLDEIRNDSFNFGNYKFKHYINIGKGNNSLNSAIYKILEKMGYKQKVKDYIEKCKKYRKELGIDGLSRSSKREILDGDKDSGVITRGKRDEQI